VERLVLSAMLLGTVAAVPGWERMAATGIGCGIVLLAYRERWVRPLWKFLVLWGVFSVAVGAGRYWAGTGLHALIVDSAASVGLALGVASAALLVMAGQPSEILRGMDRIRVPREVAYAILALARILPQLSALGTRQLALLELKGLRRDGVGQRLRAYPRIVAPLFGILLNQQLAHARSLGLRGFFGAPVAASRRGIVVGRTGWALAALLGLNGVAWYVVASWLS
jgi:energy-coupling factor transporter transmembrane protein EcfT